MKPPAPVTSTRFCLDTCSHSFDRVCCFMRSGAALLALVKEAHLLEGPER